MGVFVRDRFLSPSDGIRIETSHRINYKHPNHKSLSAVIGDSKLLYQPSLLPKKVSHHSHINGHQVSLTDYFRNSVQDLSFVMTNDDDAL